MGTVRTDAENNCVTEAEISARHPPPRSGLVQPVIYRTAFVNINIDKCRLQEECLRGPSAGSIWFYVITNRRAKGHESITELFVDNVAEWFAGDETPKIFAEDWQHRGPFLARDAADAWGDDDVGQSPELGIFR
jgi:hypothetical protein